MQLRIERAALALLALGAALPSLAIGLAAQAEAADQTRFAAPLEPLVLTRTVWRTLHDGKQIVVRRSYLLTFEANGDGYTVTGQQLASTVEAPPAMEAIARIERGRIDISAFPLRLDAAGMIRFGSFSASDLIYREGENAGRAIIATSTLSTADQRDSEALLASVVAKGGSIPWPRDLFNPREANRTERREVPLPDGSTGILTITFSAESSLDGRVPAKVEREVVSELAGTRRVSREEWVFAPRVGP